MATETAQQVLDDSYDAAGLSTVSATMTAENLRRGTMYNPVILAAGVPVWFHALQDRNYLALFRSRWINAVVGIDGPQSYTAHQEVTAPCWVTVIPATGTTSKLGKIPTLLDGEVILSAACTRVDYVYTVGTIDTEPLIQHHRVTEAGLMSLAGEEILPLEDFTPQGCYIDNLHFVVLGTDSTGNLYQARRYWGRVGSPDRTPTYTWEYRHAKGWSDNPAEMAPMGLRSDGPVSVARVRDRLLISTVWWDNPDYFARLYTARQADKYGTWKRVGPTVPLGNAATYLGGGLYLQGQLDRNPTAVLDPSVGAAIPYVTSVKTVSGSEESIVTSWGLWTVPR